MLNEIDNSKPFEKSYVPLLSPSEIAQIFTSGRLFEQNSFYYLDKITKYYDESRRESNYIKESQLLYDKFKSGHTIIVKNLENYNESIIKRASELGKGTNVHMYLVPPDGVDSFDYHQDDRDVYVHLVSGSKRFKVKDTRGEKEYHLRAGEELFLKKGTVHKAIPNGASCLLSFGVGCSLDYLVPSQFKTEDFC